MKRSDKLQDFLTLLTESAEYQMKSPGVTTTLPDGRNKTLYMAKVASIEEKTRLDVMLIHTT